MKPSRHQFTTDKEWEAIKEYPKAYSILIRTLTQRQAAQWLLTGKAKI